MEYRYKKNQLFRKKLDIPKEVLDKVYGNFLTLEEYYKYDLADKVPSSCLITTDKYLIDRYGIEKCKNLDFEMINKWAFAITSLLHDIPTNTNDLNEAITRAIINKYQKLMLESNSITEKMKETCPEYFVDSKISYEISRKFYKQDLSLIEIIKNWDKLKDKRIDESIEKGSNNFFTKVSLTEFMDKYQNLIMLFDKDSEIFSSLIFFLLDPEKTDEEKNQYIKKSLCAIDKRSFTDDDYKMMFEYIPLVEYLEDNYNITEVKKFITKIPDLDYIYNCGIPLNVILKESVFKLISDYGLECIIEFNENCGNFFSKNDYQNLMLLYDTYFTSPYISTYKYYIYDNNKQEITRAYTKEEFYLCLRNMLISNPISSWFDYREISGEFREINSDIFMNEMAPQELQDAFYQRKIDREYISNHPAFIEYLSNIKLELLFKRMGGNFYGNGTINFINILEDIFNREKAFEFMMQYGKYLESAYKIDEMKNFKIENNITNESFIEQIEKYLFDSIINNGIIYDEKIPKNFKNKYHELFLSENLSNDFKDKFYNRKLTIEDFKNDHDLIDMIGHTNISCGFPQRTAWTYNLFNNIKNSKIANLNRLLVIEEFYKIKDIGLQKVFEEYITKYSEELDSKKIKYVSKILIRLSFSNSKEMYSFREILARQLLETEDPVKNLNEIEDIFLKNNIPTIGKIYSCFELLHPDFKGFDFSDNPQSKISPVLKEKSTKGKKIVVFSDLLKAAFGSNNRSIIEYLNNMEDGNKLYENIKYGHVQYNELNDTEKNKLNIFREYLLAAYKNTIQSKNEIDCITITNNIIEDILELQKKLSLDGSIDYNLADRAISMFCHFAGINTLEEAKKYIKTKVEYANLKNIKAASQDILLEKGDFVKGIGNIKYLKNILQNGSVSKEYLGSDAGSDATPLDTDVSVIESDEGNIDEKIKATAANDYGPIYFVLKNNERFIITRTKDGNTGIENDMSKLEAFYTGVLGGGHYGIRSGFASSEIDYIVMENYDNEVGLEIAINGFYIPVVNRKGKIVFTPQDYIELREKMAGLSYYGENNYTLSDNLITEEIKAIASLLENNNKETQEKNEKIDRAIKQFLEEYGLSFKNEIDGDLTENSIEFINTGSTGRGTNSINDGDYDYMMRLDSKIISDEKKLRELKIFLLKKVGIDNPSEKDLTGDFRLTGVQIDKKTKVDLDITFERKTNSIEYSTDMALKDRFNTIKKENPEKYKYVVANIILAKQVLKKAEVYKSKNGKINQGGLGGVGIENWILQNGGSFIDAIDSFLAVSEGKTFEEFKSSYQIWDFGENHLAERRNQYPHDNFVANSMNEEGYYNMIEALKEYKKSLNYEQENTIKR